MAGMFYSLKEAAEKLNKTEKEIKELAKQGKLREFRDGSNLLFKIDEVEALMAGASVPAAEEAPIPLEQPTGLVEAAETEETLEPEQAPKAEQPTEPEQAAEEEEILLAPETGVPAAVSELTSADTALTGEGVSVLGETDRDYQVTDDTMAETIAVPGATGTLGMAGTTGEASLEEIEEDVSLDTFGSGSGLLDLSLQADDTSLGGILDEIYTAEGTEEGQEPAGPGSAVGMAAEAEQMLAEEELTGPQPAPGVLAVAPGYIESAPDTQSNTLGMLLFLPLLALLYTAIVAVAAQRGVMPSILAKIQGVIWYVMIGAVVVAGLIVGAAFMLGGEATGKRQKRPKKSKKTKKAPPTASENTSA